MLKKLLLTVSVITTFLITEEVSAQCLNTASSTSWPTVAGVTPVDLTPNKLWGTDADCVGGNDTYVDWCGAVSITTAVATSGTSDITCTPNNSASSFWGEFTYNSTSVLDYGDMLGFKVQGSGNAGDDVYARVYDKTTGCPIGPCNLNGGNNYDMDLSTYGLTDGTNYYLRIWSSQSNAGTASLTSAKVSCGLRNTYNDLHDNAAPICTHTTGGTFSTHVTTNGNTIGTSTSGSSDCWLDNSNGGGFTDINCAGQNVVTNDSWFKTCTGSTGGTLTMSETNLACQGTGIQFWMFADGTGGSNNNNLTGNDFCWDGVWREGSSDDFSSKLICVSPASSNTSTSVSVSANTCYYFLTDGYSGAYCEYDLTATCTGCILLPSASCWSDVTGPYITSVVASTVSASQYIVNMSEPIRCCEIDATDFKINATGCAAGVGTTSITSAVGVNCQFDPCGSYTSQVLVTISPVPPSGYNNCWYIEPSSTSNYVDMCMTPDGATPPGSAQILPVDLLYFNGMYNKTEGSVLTYWATSSEKNNDYFTIEKSANGASFELLGTVKGGGNSSTQKEYALFDQNPYTGINYYRLSQTDFDGQRRFIGGVISVNVGGKFNVESLTYNNTYNQIVVKSTGDLPRENNFTIRMYDLMGQVIYEKQVSLESNGTTTIDADLISNGVYIVTLSDGKKINFKTKVPVYNNK